MTERDPDDGPSYPRRTVIWSVPKSLTPHSPIFSMCRPTDTVRPAQPFWLSETLFQRVSHFFYVSSNGYMGRTVIPMMVRPAHTIMMVRDLIPKGLSNILSILKRISTIDRHTFDSPSCITIMTVRDPYPKGLHTFSKYPLTDTYDG